MLTYQSIQNFIKPCGPPGLSRLSRIKTADRHESQLIPLYPCRNAFPGIPIHSLLFYPFPELKSRSISVH